VHPGDGAYEEPVTALSNLRGIRELQLNGERADAIAAGAAAHGGNERGRDNSWAFSGGLMWWRAWSKHKPSGRSNAACLRGGWSREEKNDASEEAATHSNDALSGRGPTEHQETRWTLPAVRLNA
jgi:hypothetical protein